MKLLRHALMVLFVSCSINPLFAQPALPDKNNKDGWQDLVNQFAECSAVYNIAATMKDAPEKGSTSTYRELANNALIAGMSSSQHIDLPDSYLEAIYSTKYGLWQEAIKDKTQVAKLFAKANQCLSESLPVQNLVVNSLHTQSAQK